MRLLLLLPLLAGFAAAQPSVIRVQWANPGASDSITGVALQGAYSGAALGVLRMNSASTAFEIAAPTGSGAPVNAVSPDFTGTITVVGLTASSTATFNGAVNIAQGPSSILRIGPAYSGFSLGSTTGIVFTNSQSDLPIAQITANNSGSPVWRWIRRRGSLTSHSAPLDGDVLGSLQFSGSATFSNLGAGFFAVSNGNWVDGSNRGTRLSMYGVSNGSTTLTEWMRWIEGNTLIGSTTNTGERLQVTGNAIITGDFEVVGGSQFSGNLTIDGGDMYYNPSDVGSPSFDFMCRDNTDGYVFWSGTPCDQL